jgi:hypothetical protein
MHAGLTGGGCPDRPTALRMQALLWRRQPAAAAGGLSTGGDAHLSEGRCILPGAPGKGQMHARHPEHARIPGTAGGLRHQAACSDHHRLSAASSNYATSSDDSRVCSTPAWLAAALACGLPPAAYRSPSDGLQSWFWSSDADVPAHCSTLAVAVHVCMHPRWTVPELAHLMMSHCGGATEGE